MSSSRHQVEHGVEVGLSLGRLFTRTNHFNLYGQGKRANLVRIEKEGRDRRLRRPREYIADSVSVDGALPQHLQPAHTINIHRCRARGHAYLVISGAEISDYFFPRQLDRDFTDTVVLHNLHVFEQWPAEVDLLHAGGILEHICGAARLLENLGRILRIDC